MSDETLENESVDEGVTFDVLHGPDTLNASDFEDEPEPEAAQTSKPAPEPKQAPVAQKVEAPRPDASQTAQATPVVEAPKTNEQLLGEKAVELLDGQRLRVKGREFDVSQFSKEDVARYLQKGLRSDQLFEEAATARKEAERQQAVNEQAARQWQYLLQQRAQGQQAGPDQAGNLPPELRPSEDDTPTETNLKRNAAQLWQEQQSFREFQHRQAQQAQYNQAATEIQSLRDDYPLADIDSVVVLKAMYPQARIEDLMAKSHAFYSSQEFVEKTLSHNPTVRSVIAEKFINEYLAKKSEVNNPPVKGKGSGRAPAEGMKVPDQKDMDFKKAGAYLKEVLRKRQESGEEDDLS